MRFHSLVLKNTLRNKRRTALTVLSLSLALFLVVFFDTVFKNWSQSSEEVPESRRRLIVTHRSFSTFLPESHAKVIAGIEGVDLVAPFHWFNGRLRGRQKDYFASFAVEVETFQSVWGEYRLQPREYDAWLRNRQGAVVGRRLLEKFGWKLGQRITLTSSVYPGCEPELELFATYEGGQDEETLLFNRRYMQELLRGTPYYGRVGMFYVVVKDPARSGEVIEAIDAALAGSQAPTKSETEKDFLVKFVTMVGDVRGFIMKASFVVLGVVLLVVMNTMAMSVRERTREIAVLKAIGFTPRRVVALVIAEGVVTAALAGLFGCVGPRILFEHVLRRPTILKYFTNFSPPWSTVFLGLAAALAIGVVSALLPAAAAARIDVARGLRRIG